MTHYVYDDYGRLVKKQYPNNLETEYQFNELGQLKSLINSKTKRDYRSKDIRETLDQFHYEYVNHVINSLNVSENNVHIPNWRGRNNPRERVRGGAIVEDYIRNILSNNTNAEILIIGYSHGGNVVKIALNNIFSDDYELDLSNVTMVGTAAPALQEYQLNNVQGLNDQFNFYNTRDATQANFAGIGSSARRQDPSGTLWRPSDQWGRAQYTVSPENNIRVIRDVPYGRNNIGGAAAHSIMRTSQIIWDLYKIDPIREAKGW